MPRQHTLASAGHHQLALPRRHAATPSQHAGHGALTIAYPLDVKYPHSVDAFLELPFPEATKRKYLWDNCAALYGFA